MRALVLRWRALVVFLVVAVTSGSVAGAQTIEIPQSCATQAVIQGFLEQIEQRKNAEITCTIGGQAHKFSTAHIWWALKHYGDSGHGYPFKDFVVNLETTAQGNGGAEYVPAGPGLGFCFLPDGSTRALIYKVNYGGDDPGLNLGYPIGGGQCDWRASGNQSTLTTYLTAYSQSMTTMLANASIAYKSLPPQMFANPFNNLIWNMTFAQTAPWSDVYGPEEGSDGGTPPAGGTTTCTRPDGTQTTNQYECSPKDQDTNCSVLDIPCNLKKLFIPKNNEFDTLTDAMKNKIPFSVIKAITEVPFTCTTNVQVPYIGSLHQMTLDWCFGDMATRLEPLLRLMGNICAVWFLANIARFFG